MGTATVFLRYVVALSHRSSHVKILGEHQSNLCCLSCIQDYGKHYLAAEVTDEFLDFSANQGNDLRGGISQPDGSVAELKGGCKWSVEIIQEHLSNS